MFHTLAFTLNNALGTSYTAIPAVLDTILPPSGNGVLPPTDLWLLAGT